MRKKFPTAILLGATLAVCACFDESKDKGNSGGEPPPVALNTPPTIAGTPPPDVLEGETYEFTPAANDTDGDTLQFSIARKPAWATFDPATGRLAGNPDAADVGTFTNIAITVSDGMAAASLASFDISVNEIAMGAATLNWSPPTENADGSALTNLAGYRIYYGRSHNSLNRTIVVNNPGLTSYVVENLSPAIWHFTMTSVNARGTESNRSSTVSKTIS